MRQRFSRLFGWYFGAIMMALMFVFPLLILTGFLSLQAALHLSDWARSIPPVELYGGTFVIFAVIGTGVGALLAGLHLWVERLGAAGSY